jgi:hypothetical protein
MQTGAAGLVAAGCLIEQARPRRHAYRPTRRLESSVMPTLTYLGCVGALLLALMFVADSYLPNPVAAKSQGLETALVNLANARPGAIQ